MVEIKRATSSVDVEQCFPVIKFLRPHLVKTAFLEKVKRQQSQGYQLVFIVSDDRPAALVGYRIQDFLAWGKVLYVDDLITHPDCLKKGYASQLLDWVIDEAKREKCEQIHLDSGYQRNDAHRLYLNKGFDLVSHHFAKTLNKND